MHRKSALQRCYGQAFLRAGVDFVFFEEAVERLAVVLDVAPHLDIGRPLFFTTPFIKGVYAYLEVLAGLFHTIEFHHTHPEHGRHSPCGKIKLVLKSNPENYALRTPTW